VDGGRERRGQGVLRRRVAGGVGRSRVDGGRERRGQGVLRRRVAGGVGRSRVDGGRERRGQGRRAGASPGASAGAAWTAGANAVDRGCCAVASPGVGRSRVDGGRERRARTPWTGSAAPVGVAWTGGAATVGVAWTAGASAVDRGCCEVASPGASVGRRASVVDGGRNRVDGGRERRGQGAPCGRFARAKAGAA